MKTLNLTLPFILALLLSSFQLGNKHQTTDSIADKLAFNHGEELRFRVHYSMINAATIILSVDDKLHTVNNRAAFKVKARGYTHKSFDWMYKVRDYYESYVDTAQLVPLKYFKEVKENKYHDLDLVYYNQNKKYLTTKDKKGKIETVSFDSNVQDIASAIYYARSLDFASMKIGQQTPVDIYLDSKIYKLGFKFLGLETIKSDVGKVKCYKVQPQVVKDEIFTEEDAMTIWISADENKIPVRIQTDIWIGALKIDLTKYKNLKFPFTAKN